MFLACFVHFIQPWSFWRGRHPRKLEVSGVGDIPASWRSPAWDTSPQAGGLRRGKDPCKTLRLISSLEPLARCWFNPNLGATIFGTMPLENYPSEHIWPLTSSLIRPYPQLDPTSTVNAHKHAGKTHVNPLVTGVSQ